MTLFIEYLDPLSVPIVGRRRASPIQPGCNLINTLTWMKSNQIEVSFLGRSSQLNIFSIYTRPSKLPSKTKFR
jgi:hypothetical protein